VFPGRRSKAIRIDDIPISANVNRLKAAIQQRVKILHDIDPDDLKLWKVVSLKFQGRAPSDFLFQLNVMVPIGPDHSLAQRLAALGNIDACSRELSSGERSGGAISRTAFRGHLHIVVQRPGEYRWLIVPYEQN
jgi:hypothetical protein